MGFSSSSSFSFRCECMDNLCMCTLFIRYLNKIWLIGASESAICAHELCTNEWIAAHYHSLVHTYKHACLLQRARKRTCTHTQRVGHDSIVWTGCCYTIRFYPIRLNLSVKSCAHWALCANHILIHSRNAWISNPRIYSSLFDFLSMLSPIQPLQFAKFKKSRIE